MMLMCKLDSILFQVALNAHKVVN
uniref:Uncharacterized protein n=1 Tax=Anguilla anguilla TaxID=7936 RepID=A0A0E9TR46_ANGAN